MLANVISLIRPTFAIWLFTCPEFFLNSLYIFCLVTAAALSDFFDGYVARIHQSSQWGKMLDPVCDFCFVVALMYFAYSYHQLPAWFLYFMALRYIIISVITTLFLNKSTKIPGSTTWGKIAIIVNMFTVVFFILVPANSHHYFLLVLSTGIQILSLYDYFTQYLPTIVKSKRQ